MKIRSSHKISVAAAFLILMTILTGCGRKSSTEEDAASSAAALSLAGTWQTASMGYEYHGTEQAEYYVQFTDTDIIYGHLKDGQFVTEYTNEITSFAESAAGIVRVQAESSGGVRYTYQTCESDSNVLEYFETWDEDDFPEMYRGGASLSRNG